MPTRSTPGPRRPPRAPSPAALAVLLVVLAIPLGVSAGRGLNSPVRGADPAAGRVADPPVSSANGERTRSAVRRLVARGQPFRRVSDRSSGKPSGAPGAAALARDKAGTRFAAAGVADLGTGRPIHRNDRFRVGSITKTFLAAVVLQLTAEHRLGLDDTVESLLPGLLTGHGDDGRRITVRQLLNHTSGLFSYTDDPAFARRLTGAGFTAHRYDTRSPRSLVRIALAHPPTSAPGANWRYSNTNYLVLGMIVRQVTGRSYASEATRRILRPLRLTATSFPGTRATLPAPHGRAYSTRTGRPLDVTDLNPSGAGAAGEVVSTLDDLNRFYGALLRGDLLRPRQLALMRDTAATHGRYGMGLFPVKLPCGRTVWGHNGDITGSHAQTLGTAGGTHLLSYRVNTDTPAARGRVAALLAGEFCGRG
ncbi:serine hydrolase domain-containing protein [Streptomyces sp. H27-D2]|uniref:serine hydrolase domain-containing protein n=1 Tax=Streptomyces sp. H27-D2 TaxID=3046304 RepID=UPI002DB56F59|nr:serine hydrolase domain-containing protein [Streptomyces sp. H27-D2]MEC4017458.1 serine hydrolase domain-containing protein [Streptomyces sp. H27-D2]